MVRRRTRATASSKTSSQHQTAYIKGSAVITIDPSQLLDEQYFASPKRKDCKIEQDATTANADIDETIDYEVFNDKNKNKCSSFNKIKDERFGINGRSLGTNSQNHTIENFFKSTALTKQNNKYKDLTIVETKYRKPSLSASISSTYLSKSALQRLLKADNFGISSTDCLSELSEDTNDSEKTDLSEEQPSPAPSSSPSPSQSPSASATLTNGFPSTFEFNKADASTTMANGHLSADSNSNRNMNENIFLQEPVLTLNIDKNFNQATNIKINKSFELPAKFAAPTNNLTATALYGRFNQIVSLNNANIKLEAQLKNEPNDDPSVQLPKSDNIANDANSCNTQSPSIINNHRNKPTTPHRILCPSPDKTLAHCVSAAELHDTHNKMLNSQSPRKSHRHLTTTAAAAICGSTTTAITKTRRRLNTSIEHHIQPYTKSNCKLNQTTIDNKHQDNGGILINYGIHNHQTNDIKPLEDKLKKETSSSSSISQIPETIPNEPTSDSSKCNSTNKTQQQKPAKTQTKNKHNAIKSINQLTNGNREISEFFPVRRSIRKTKTVVKEEMMRDLEKAVLEERCDGLSIAYFDGKGRGIIAERDFKRGEFVIEYMGDLISTTEAAKREQQYALDENAGCYMYYFKHKNQQYCIDATADTGKFGRLVNHSRNGNLMTKIIEVKQVPHLVLIAKDNIQPGEELCYDYGDRSKESLLHHPWLAF